MKSIKWLKACYPGLDAGGIYQVAREWGRFIFFYDEWGRLQTVHTRYNGILFAEVSNEP
jgi:hypothetical protein